MLNKAFKPFLDVVDRVLVEVNKVYEIQLNSQAVRSQIMAVCILKDCPDVAKQRDHLGYTPADLRRGH